MPHLATPLPLRILDSTATGYFLDATRNCRGPRHTNPCAIYLAIARLPGTTPSGLHALFLIPQLVPLQFSLDLITVGGWQVFHADSSRSRTLAHPGSTAYTAGSPYGVSVYRSNP